MRCRAGRQRVRESLEVDQAVQKLTIVRRMRLRVPDVRRLGSAERGQPAAGRLVARLVRRQLDLVRQLACGGGGVGPGPEHRGLLVVEDAEHGAAELDRPQEAAVAAADLLELP